MEGNTLSPPSGDICNGNELNRSNSGASTLTADICEDILHHSPEDGTMWTDEKHSSFLENLEVSFVKQLHQSMSLLAHCSNRDERNEGISQTFERRAAPVHGCCEDMNCNKGDPLSHVSVDSLSHVKRPWVYHSKRIGTARPTASTHTPDASRQSSASNQYGDPHHPVNEGTGQNFGDEDDEINSSTKPRVKRVKTVLPD